MEELEQYLNQDIFNPKYLFHGTSEKLEIIEPRQTKDKSNPEVITNAVYLSSWFPTSAAYAFMKTLDKIGIERGEAEINNDGEIPAMTIETDYIPEDLTGYVYIFEKTDDMTKKHEHTTEYTCPHALMVNKVIKVNYNDFKQYFERKNCKRRSL